MSNKLGAIHHQLRRATKKYPLNGHTQHAEIIVMFKNQDVHQNHEQMDMYGKDMSILLAHHFR